MAQFRHETVLLEEAVQALRVHPSGRYLDCTAGGAGHSCAILERLGPDGRLLSLDRDLRAVEVARARLLEVARARGAAAGSFEVVHAPFSALGEVLDARDLGPLDGILADLGTSSPQLDDADRGFSFQGDGPLDMRMDPTRGPSAADLLASLSESELADLIFRLGDEPKSRRVARAIVRAREQAPLARTSELAELVARAVGGKRGKIHPATRVFQALRMRVNDELGELASLLDEAPRRLKPGGVLAIITFHSGEDRAVKRAFRALCGDGPPDPHDPYGTARRGAFEPVSRRGVAPSPQEVSRNPRSRSARLRAVRRTAAA